MDRETSWQILAQVREKRGESFPAAVQQMANTQLQSDALHDVRNLAMASLGVGMGARGLTGIYNLLANRKANTARSSPPELPLPYPVEPDEEATRQAHKQAGLADSATIKPGIPWYGPAMLMGGLAGLGTGWAGMDAVLDHRRKAEHASQLEQAKEEFHNALLSQYSKPLDSVPNIKRAETDSVGVVLDRVFDLFEKHATWSDTVGAGLGAYGMYGGITALAAGAAMYNQANKKSQRSIIAKALQRREQRRFMEQPPEIYARPEPIVALPKPDPQADEEAYKAAAQRPFLARMRRLVEVTP